MKEDWKELGVKSIGGMVGIQVGREQEERKREDDAGFEKIEDFNVPSNAEEKFAGATTTSAFSSSISRSSSAERKEKCRHRD